MLSEPKPVPLRVDMGEGHITHDDSFSMTLQAAARALKLPTPSYENVFVLSSNALAPGISLEEDCWSWKMMYGRGQALDFVATQLGLRVCRIWEAPPWNTYGEDMAPQRKSRLSELRKAMAQGALIITDGGWEITSGPNGFVPWCWWGIITSLDDDGMIRGATINGKPDNPLHHVNACWLVEKASDAVPQAQSGRAVLTLATARIRGNPPFDGDKIVYGLSALDLLIRQMETQPYYCPQEAEKCPERGYLDAIDNAGAIAKGAKVSAGYLRSHRTDFPEAVQPHILSAAEHYDRIVLLLAPALDKDNVHHYQKIIGNLESQKAHARDVLRPVRTELESIAAALEQAIKLWPENR